ncbi:MAG TPA: DUF6538 domain-containing protein, partial [Desulfotignum sp.]|nr:DUF6538 domain-containing protein [Desulfotignum sp.]
MNKMAVHFEPIPAQQKGDKMARLPKNPNHLQRVGTKYHFRYKLPKPHMGEIKLSLKTGCLKHARQLSGILKHEVMRLTGDSMDISKEQIKAALGEHLRRELDRTDEKRLNGSEPYQINLPAFDLKTLQESKA